MLNRFDKKDSLLSPTLLGTFYPTDQQLIRLLNQAHTQEAHATLTDQPSIGFMGG